MKVKPLLQCHVLVSVDSGIVRPPGIRFPALEKLLARAGRQQVLQGGRDAWLCKAFSVAQQQDLPVAPLAAAGEGLRTGRAYWLHADPVHFLLLRDRMVLDASSITDMSQEASDAIFSILNGHFSRDGMIFEKGPHTGRWYLRLQNPPNIHTCPLPEAAGRDIGPLMPSGTEASYWRSVINEIQMLLHESPVNLGREAAGKAPANSVWLWGGGIMPNRASAMFDQIWSDQPLVLGLARASGHEARPVPRNANDWLQELPETGACLVDLGVCDLAGAEKSWFQPLRPLLQARTISTLHVHCCQGSEVRSFSLNSIDLWKVWRKNKPLGALLSG